MAEVIHSSTPVARKAHQCMVCRAMIEPGTRYVRSLNKMDDVYTWIEHDECRDVGNESLEGWWDEGYNDESVRDFLADIGESSMSDKQRIVWDRIQSRMVEGGLANE